MLDNKREKQLQEFNQRLKALQNEVDILKKKGKDKIVKIKHVIIFQRFFIFLFFGVDVS